MPTCQISTDLHKAKPSIVTDCLELLFRMRTRSTHLDIAMFTVVGISLWLVVDVEGPGKTETMGQHL